MPKFKVTIYRTEVKSQTFEVEAPRDAEAGDFAFELAYNHDYSGSKVVATDYEKIEVEAC